MSLAEKTAPTPQGEGGAGTTAPAGTTPAAPVAAVVPTNLIPAVPPLPAPAAPAPAATPPAPPAPLSAEDKPLTRAEWTALLQDQLPALIKGAIAEQQPPKPRAAAPAAGPTPATPVQNIDEALAKNAQIQSLLTKDGQREQELAQLRTEVAQEKAQKEQAKKEAEAARVHQALVTELVDPEVGVASFTAQKAAKMLLQVDKAVEKDPETGDLYLKCPDANGKVQTYPLREGIRAWMKTKDGQVFLPSMPSGSGTAASNFTGLRAMPGGKGMNRADAFQLAVLRQQGGKGK